MGCSDEYPYTKKDYTVCTVKEFIDYVGDVFIILTWHGSGDSGSFRLSALQAAIMRVLSQSGHVP